MTLHLLKLCVGAESVDSHRQWIQHSLALKRKRGLPAEQWHTTRMVPKRSDELLAGGSLYWVIQGTIQARQRLLDIRVFDDLDGVRRCNLVMEPELVLTRPQPRRPFQGWRYLLEEDAPVDLADGSHADVAMPAEMQRDLARLGLL